MKICVFKCIFHMYTYIPLCYNIIYYIILHYIISYDITFCYIISHHIALSYSLIYYITAHDISPFILPVRGYSPQPPSEHEAGKPSKKAASWLTQLCVCVFFMCVFRISYIYIYICMYVSVYVYIHIFFMSTSMYMEVHMYIKAYVYCWFDSLNSMLVL